MEHGMTPVTVLWDVPTEFPTGSNPPWYAPKNYNGRWNGPVRMRTALANSLNMPAVKALRHTGLENLLGLLDRVGIKSGLKRGPQHYGLSLTLGGGEVTLLELTTAYNTLASGGRYYPPTSILKITDSEGNILEAYEPAQPDPVVDPAQVAIITDMLSDDKAREPIWGLNSDLKLSRPAAVKTGTSEDWRDAWTVGYTPYATVGVWSGNNNNEPTFKVESIQGGGVIWHNVMEELFTWMDRQPVYRQLFSQPFNGSIPNDFSQPDNLKQEQICRLPGPFGNYTEELFTEDMIAQASSDDDANTNNKMGCNMYRSFNVVRVPSGGYCQPARGQSYRARTINFWDLPENDPDIRVRYVWDGGSAGNPGNFPLCSNVSFATPVPPTAVPATAVPTAVPTVAAPAPGAVRMPQVVGLSESDARAVLASVGATSVYVDYQTRDRIPGSFDQFAPYTVLSSVPAPGGWIMPGTSVVLGVRAPESQAPAPAPPTAVPPTAVPPTQVPPTQVPADAPPTPTAIILPLPSNNSDN
jgi:peptidoglycan glycosyltransferase